MKRSLSALSLCLLLFSVSEAQSNRFRTGDAFKGPVRSARIERAQIFLENGEYKEGPRTLVVADSYAPDWSWMNYIGYNPDGTINQKILTTYNANGDQTSIAVFNGDGKLKSKIVYVYKDGKVVEEQRFDGDGSLKQRRVTVWSNQGQVIEFAYYDGSGALIKRGVNTRDAQKSVWTTYDPQGRIIEEAVHYLTYGHPKTEITRYSPNGTVLDKYVSQSDENTGQIDKAEYNSDGTPKRKTSEKREYDSQGNLSKITNYAWDEATGKFQPVSVSYYTITYAETR
jgi:YD repeat-containing protein